MTTSHGPTFGELLRRLRRAAGLTQEELAGQATVSVRAISDLERGLKYRPRRDTVQLLADALALSGPERMVFEAAARRPGFPPEVPALTAADTLERSAHLRTILIADIRGYTAFTLDCGDTEAARLTERFARLTREAVAARGGEVVELRGDEALCVFTSARQALRASVELQDRFASESRADPTLPLRAGIGLDAGESVPVDGGYRGAALNLAARLCSLAGPGEVLASETVINLARKTEGLEYGDWSEVSPKGFAEPVRVARMHADVQPEQAHPEAEAASAGASTKVRLPIGGFLGSLPAGQLVARDYELEEVLKAVDAALGGDGQTVLLVGEPGAGKTRLAQEVTLQLRNRGFLIAVGRCYDAEQTVPYYPFLSALPTVYALAPDSIRREAPRRWPHLGALVPDRMTAAEETGTPDYQHRIFRAVESFLTTVAESAPAALLLDDLHWADPTSLKLLLHLARETRTSRIFILATYRDVEVGRHHALEEALRELGREQLARRIQVRRLDPAATAQLISATLGEGSVSAEFADLVHSRTEGNPFFVQQVLRVLVERGDLYREDGRWTGKAVGEIAVPESIRSAIGQRLSRLREETQEALREASVLGELFDFGDLEAISGRTERSLEAALDEAAGTGLVRELDPDTFGFDHVLTQQALDAELTGRRRRRLHLAAGEAIEQLPEARRNRRAAELARHFLEGDDPARAIPYLLQAGSAAFWVGALDEAIHHYRTALESMRETGDRAQEANTMVWLGFCLECAGHHSEGLALIHAAVTQAEANNDVATVITGIHAIAHNHAVHGELERAREYYEWVGTEAGEGAFALRRQSVLMARGWVLWWLGDWTEARSYYERALRASHDWAFDLSSGCRVDLARLSLAQGDWEQARLYLQENLDQDEALLDPVMLLYSHWLLGKLELLEGQPEAARARIEAVYRDQRLGWEDRVEVLPILAEVYLALGEVDKADAVAAECVELARAHTYLPALVGALDVQGSVCSAQRRWADAERLFEEAVSLARPMPYPHGEALALYHWGLMDLQRHELDPARDRLEAAQAIFRRLGARPDLERAEQALARFLITG